MPGARTSLVRIEREARNSDAGFIQVSAGNADVFVRIEREARNSDAGFIQVSAGNADVPVRIERETRKGFAAAQLCGRGRSLSEQQSGHIKPHANFFALTNLRAARSMRTRTSAFPASG